jgi:hypothetical protein
MPPRITRLTWPRLFPPHEPLPFLYPRWYAAENNTTIEVPQSSTPKDSATSEGQDATTQNELGNTSSTSPDVKTEDGNTGVRPVPPVLKRKVQVRKLQEAKRLELRAKSFYANDWRTPLTLLRKHTPTGEQHHVKKLAQLKMPQGMRGFYPGNLYDLFLDIYLHTGCHVQIVRGDDHADDKFSALELSGTLTSIRMAKDILNEMVQVESDDDVNDKGNLGSYTITATPVVSDKVMPRSVWSMPSTQATELSEVIEPTCWSFNAFSAYVEALVSAVAPPPRPKSATQSPKTTKSHVDLVTGRLMALYRNPDSVRWASMRPTVLTLQYLAQKSKTPEVRQVLGLVEAQSKTHAFLRLILANPSVFNVLLDSASQASDLHTYNFLLRMMTDRGVAPTIDTWTSLLQLVRKVSPRNAKHIVNMMRQKEMLSSPPAKAATASVNLSASAAEWLGRDESIFDFIAHYDKLWDGKEWFETFGCNQILTLLIERGKLQDTLPLIKELENRNKRPNLVTAHTLINGAASYRDLTFAIQALEATLGKSKILQPDSDTFDKLSHLAFRVRAYNTLRVVWRYACLRGEVSREFVRKMQKTLMNPPRGQGEAAQTLDVGVGVGVGVDDKVSRHQRFKAMAPLIAVGIVEAKTAEISTLMPNVQVKDGKTPASAEVATSLDTAATPEVIESSDAVESSEITASPETTTSLNTELPSSIDPPLPKRDSLHPTLAADLLAHEKLVPTISFMSALRMALDKDLLWKQQGYDKEASLQVLLAEAIAVGVKPRVKPRDEFPWQVVKGRRVSSHPMPFRESVIRKTKTKDPAVPFEEGKVRPIGFKTLDFNEDTVRKVKLVDNPWKEDPFIFVTAKLESEEEKQAYRDREAAAKRKLHKLNMIKNQKLKEERKRLEEKDKLEDKNRVEKLKRLERQEKPAEKRLADERTKVDKLQDLATQAKIPDAKTTEEKQQLDEQQALRRKEEQAIREQEAEARKTEEKKAKEEAEKRTAAKEKALDLWTKAMEERKKAEEQESEANDEWKKLHAEMKEMMERNKNVEV